MGHSLVMDIYYASQSQKKYPHQLREMILWLLFGRETVHKDCRESFNADKLEHIYYPLMFFQRWKEKFFVNVGAECGLTIAGFYYVCFSRSDGSVDGFYYDPNSTYGLHKIYQSSIDDIVLGDINKFGYFAVPFKS